MGNFHYESYNFIRNRGNNSEPFKRLYYYHKLTKRYENILSKELVFNTTLIIYQIISFLCLIWCGAVQKEKKCELNFSVI